MKTTSGRRVLVCSDMTSLKQTFVARANVALVEAGHDYRMVMTRGDWSDAAVDRPLSPSFRFALAPSQADLLALPGLLMAGASSPRLRAYLRASYKPELGRRLALTAAAIQYRTFVHAQRFKPDVILTHFLWNLKPALALAEALEVPVLAIAHGSDVLLDQAWEADLAAPRLKHVFCISQALQQRVSPVAARHGKTTSLLHNPVAPLYLEPAVPPTAGALRVVCIATLRELKNHAWLFRALKLLKDKGVPFTCEVIGETFGKQRAFLNGLIAQVQQLGIAGQVAFLGWKNPAEARDHIDAATVLCLPSRSEGMGMVIVEAIARQRTPVGTDIPGIREGMDGGRYGLVAPLDDDAALADALEQAHQRTLQQQDWLEQGRAYALREYSSAHYIAQLQQHLQAALAQD